MKIKVMKTDINTNNHSSRLGGGILLLVIGLIFFLRNFGIGVPNWVFSWHTILLAIGLFIGYRRDFTGGVWLVMTVIGGVFTLEDLAGLNLSRYYVAGWFIIAGLWFIFRPAGTYSRKGKKKPLDFNFEDKPDAAGPGNLDDGRTDDPSHDYIDSVNIFGGSKHQIFSKNFKGGDVVSVFGGCDLIFSQADFEGTVTLDVIAIFGGVKIVIPPTWTVKTELTPVFGSVDDKRSIIPATGETQKILKITGVAIMGGVDIRNY
jgi:predicted membrane protein